MSTQAVLKLMVGFSFFQSSESTFTVNRSLLENELMSMLQKSKRALSPNSPRHPLGNRPRLAVDYVIRRFNRTFGSAHLRAPFESSLLLAVYNMNTRLRLTVLAAVFAFLRPHTRPARASAGTRGIEVPDGTRKCIKPENRVPVPADPFVPLACLAPVVNVSATAGNQSESFVVVNPTNTNNLVAFSNLSHATASSARIQ